MFWGRSDYVEYLHTKLFKSGQVLKILNKKKKNDAHSHNMRAYLWTEAAAMLKV